jgi:hypothetical protein
MCFVNLLLVPRYKVYCTQDNCRFNPAPSSNFPFAIEAVRVWCAYARLVKDA